MAEPLPLPTLIEIKRPPWLLIFVSVVAVFSLVSSGYFFYQNLNLQKQIAVLSIQPSPSPITLASPSPSAIPEIPTDWREFKIDFADSDGYLPIVFSIEIPPAANLYGHEGNGWDSIELGSTGQDILKYMFIRNKPSQTIEEVINNFKDPEINNSFETETKITINNTYGYKTTNNDFKYYFLTNQNTNEIAVFKLGNVSKEVEALFTQILSTFKFLD